MRPVPPRVLKGARVALRLGLVALAWVAGALFAIAVGDALYSTTLPELRPWHTARLAGEFTARRAGADESFDGYRAREDRLHAQVRELVATGFDPGRDAAVSRFSPDGGPYARRVQGDWNRSFVLAPASGRAQAAALLVHGASDSPYSMRPVALALQAAGYAVYGLRLPGHGTIPAALDAVDWRDWLAAVSLAVRQVRRDHPDLPFVFVGYSTGATLGLKHAADAVRANRLDRLPSRLVLLSPALGVTPLAPLANVQRLVSRWGLAPKARWGNIDLEIDPYKYTSFARNAGAQVAALIGALHDDLARMDRDGSIGRLPPVTSFQSIVDATVSTPALAERFYGLLRGGTSELVLYDVNRRADLQALLAFSPDAVVRAFERAPRRDYRLTVIGSAPGAAGVQERSWSPGASTAAVRPLGLAWPAGVVSLSHVAIPFPPDDPLYGIEAPHAPDGLPALGALALRGEHGALAIAPAEQLRLRSNPFHADMVARILRAAAAR
jgi:alpha-beta hydrolase superfamily lysophospholipase